MKIFQIFLSFQQLLEAVTTKLTGQTEAKNSLVPVRVKDVNRHQILRNREMQRRVDKGNYTL